MNEVPQKGLWRVTSPDGWVTIDLDTGLGDSVLRKLRSGEVFSVLGDSLGREGLRLLLTSHGLAIGSDSAIIRFCSLLVPCDSFKHEAMLTYE